MKKIVTVSLLVTMLTACQTPGSNSTNVIEEHGVVVKDKIVQTQAVDEQEIREINIIADDITVDASAGITEDNRDIDTLLAQRIIYFEYNSSLVRQQDYRVLQAHAAYLADNLGTKIRLEGHTDARGSREYNLALGEQRALAIRGSLMLQGATASQFQVASFGEELPQVAGDNELAWQQNRRVELIYTGR